MHIQFGDFLLWRPARFARPYSSVYLSFCTWNNVRITYWATIKQNLLYINTWAEQKLFISSSITIWERIEWINLLNDATGSNYLINLHIIIIYSINISKYIVYFLLNRFWFHLTNTKLQTINLITYN